MPLDDPYSLKHYGVLGMHWGVRKAEYLSGRSQIAKKRAQAQTNASQAHASGKVSRIHSHKGIDKLSFKISDKTSVNFHDAKAKHQTELAKRYEELARKVFNKPYNSKNKALHISAFEKVVLTIAGVGTAALLKPTVDVFGNRIKDYVVSRVGSKAVPKAVQLTGRALEIELAKKALGG